MVSKKIIKKIKNIVKVVGIYVFLVSCSFQIMLATVEEWRDTSDGNNVIYRFNTETRELKISGKGKITNQWKKNLKQLCTVGNSFKFFVIIGEGIKKIDNNAFWGCGMTKVSIPNSVREIGKGAFLRCRFLVEVVLPNSVTNICTNTFSGCWSLTDIVIPNSVTNIRKNAFSDCWSLTKIVIPGSVTKVGKYAFKDCYSLEKIIFDNTNSYSNILIDTYTFANCEKLKYLNTGNRYVEISQNTFYMCKQTFRNLEGKVTHGIFCTYSYYRDWLAAHEFLTRKYYKLFVR